MKWRSGATEESNPILFSQRGRFPRGCDVAAVVLVLGFPLRAAPPATVHWFRSSRNRMPPVIRTLESFAFMAFSSSSTAVSRTFFAASSARNSFTSRWMLWMSDPVTSGLAAGAGVGIWMLSILASNRATTMAISYRVMARSPLKVPSGYPSTRPFAASSAIASYAQ